MTEFESHSQAGQDRWVWETLGPGSGTFLDIGCGFPVEGSNTYALERMGWTGFLMDTVDHCSAARKASMIVADATTFDWRRLGLGYDAPRFDYLSLDIDDEPNAPPKSLKVLTALFAAGYQFRAATIEHDRYRLGDGPRNAIREMMEAAGYRLAVADVSDKGLAFEDWWLR